MNKREFVIGKKGIKKTKLKKDKGTYTSIACTHTGYVFACTLEGYIY